MAAGGDPVVPLLMSARGGSTAPGRWSCAAPGVVGAGVVSYVVGGLPGEPVGAAARM